MVVPAIGLDGTPILSPTANDKSILNYDEKESMINVRHDTRGPQGRFKQYLTEDFTADKNDIYCTDYLYME